MGVRKTRLRTVQVQRVCDYRTNVNLFRSIDAHVGGATVRLIVDGFPAPRGRSMLDKREAVRRYSDGIRRSLLLEPRGHADIRGAILTEATAPGSHAGLLFMHPAGYPALSGTGILAVTTIALERGLLVPGGDDQTVVYDTPAGTVRARATIGPASADEGRRLGAVSYVGVPSFVVHAGLPIRLGARHLRADVAYAGGFYAIVDAEGAGLGVTPSLSAELRRAAMEVGRAVESVQPLAHPLEPRLAGLDGTIFTGPPATDGADLRSATVFAGGALDRSPGGSSTAAVMAVLSAMGLLDAGANFVHESLTGARLTGRVLSSARVGESDAIVPEISGAAWITGEHAFTVSGDDPLREGFLLP